MNACEGWLILGVIEQRNYLNRHNRVDRVGAGAYKGVLGPSQHTFKAHPIGPSCPTPHIVDFNIDSQIIVNQYRQSTAHWGPYAREAWRIELTTATQKVKRFL